MTAGGLNLFEEKVKSATGGPLKKSQIDILQVNLGKLCNLSCVHCHVEAGPTKTEENMNDQTADAVIRFLKDSGIKTLDLTGGAPEMDPHFRKLVRAAREMDVQVIDRCNLTVFYVPGQEELPEFLRDNGVEIVASLPCYSRENVDKQRGNGTFDESIRALLKLNELGYGKEETGLILNLVYNPVGPHLPPPQEKLEKDYKERLLKDFGIVFNRLYTITNMPIKRYAKYLKAFGQLENYEKLLLDSFNPGTLDGLMCRNTLSVGWDGKLYDCDFNQMLGMSLRAKRSPLLKISGSADDLMADNLTRSVIPAQAGIRPDSRFRGNDIRFVPGDDGAFHSPDRRAAIKRSRPRHDNRALTVFDVGLDDIQDSEIITADHCFGCTAGGGSSCQGALA